MNWNKVVSQSTVIHFVAPHTGAWIEILKIEADMASLKVAPHTGAWIEILKIEADMARFKVAPHTGAWIEIYIREVFEEMQEKSLPTRERELKYWINDILTN